MDLNYQSFKREAKIYVLANQKWFLNIGDRNGAGAKDLPPIKPYHPSKPLEKLTKSTKCTSGSPLTENLPKKKTKKRKGRF